MNRLRTFVAAVRTGAAVLFVSVYTIIVGPPGMVLAVVFRWPSVLYWLGEGGVRGAMWLTGLRLEVVHGERILREHAALYCVNHSSNVEPPLLYVALRDLFPRLKILYKAELHRLPILAQGFDIVGFVPIERQRREQSLRAIDQAASQVRAGDSFLVFPEGTRSRTGKLLPFKKGAFILALRTEAPIVPVAILGARAAMRKGSPVIWPVTVRVVFGEAVPTAGRSVDDRDILVEEVRERVSALMI